ncbi:aminotransferase class III-fold pyridoxal phosphate-dependent enzyme [Limnohabitans sp. 2KL-3]|uniref:aminotransferase class III-fold pyridoxal phosphate-dependent enzyme n=1 Tax=Limnohabitans sp. 2KL-3 TaxID=1100700 RepID=UPI000AF22B18|nr:aminotransferase class III-fold pyridoxal phosphate-dependent enzyme [Limnohabitans sp. 2KL-3]
MNSTWISLGLLAAWAPALRRRIQLSRAKHRSLAGHSRMAKRLARWLPGYSFDESTFFGCDGAPADIQALRRAAFMALAQTLQTRHSQSIAATVSARDNISDMQFITAYRVPFQFSPMVQKHLKVGSFLESAQGVQVTDLDGQVFYDLTGSYGVNVFGADFYKKTMADGLAKTQALGPVLGSYHPVVASNAQRLKAISGLDEVSFHMSGTEAVMQAVRLARYHTGRPYIVRFCGAYHGWWEDVQPGPGNPMPPRETYTLSDMNERSLAVLRSRKDIACVLINPLQALHTNANAPGDSTLVDSSRRAAYDREAYTTWLKALRQVCTDKGIVLIFDEVFLGFRLAAGGAQAYFGVKADMVTYGKTLGGGFPVGVVCGQHPWMRRFDEKRPADICFARGTFNAHPVVMGAMSAFLDQLETPEIQAIYQGVDALWNARAQHFNATMQEHGLPLQAANMSSVWTLFYTQASRYNWMLQYYLRLEGLALSWVGTGRLIFSLNYSDADFEAVLERFVRAARQMQQDGWWWQDDQLTNRSIRRRILKETFKR